MIDRKIPLSAALLAALSLVSPPLAAQAASPDEIVLTNGDRITGTIQTMAEGVVTVETGPLGTVEIKLADIANLVSARPLRLRTTAGETYERTVTGIDDGQLVLADPAAGPSGLSITIDDLDAINPPEDPVRWTGSLNLGLALTEGNTNRRSAFAAFDAERRTDLDRMSLKATWDYSEERDATRTWNLSQRRTYGELQYDYFISERLYVYANTTALGDTLANIDLRYTVGSGLGYQFYDTEEFALSGEAGVSYISESYRDTTPDTDTLAARVAYSLRWAITETTIFLQDVQAFPSLEHSDDIFLIKDSRLRTSLTEAMFAQLQWVMDYDNTPAPGRDRIDNRWLLTAGWAF